MGIALPMRLRIFAWVFGAWAVLGGVGAGIFPMAKNLLPHLTAASLFFTGWLVTVSFFTFALRRDPFWRAFVSIGAVCIMLAGLYALSFAIEARELLQVFHSGPRPDFFWAAINEWAVLLSFYIWTIMASVMLRKCHDLSR